MIGYSVTPVIDGSKSAVSGLSVRQYSNSPNEESNPAPKAFMSPFFSLHSPNSMVNQ